MILSNITKNRIISQNLMRADSFKDRLLGLIPYKKIEGDSCLLISRCPMIHTCFMSFPIDVFFLDKNLKVCGIERNIKPWHFSRYYKNAFYALEFACGFLENSSIDYGDILRVESSI